MSAASRPGLKGRGLPPRPANEHVGQRLNCSKCDAGATPDHLQPWPGRDGFKSHMAEVKQKYPFVDPDKIKYSLFRTKMFGEEYELPRAAFDA